MWFRENKNGEALPLNLGQRKPVHVAPRHRQANVVIAHVTDEVIEHVTDEVMKRLARAAKKEASRVRYWCNSDGLRSIKGHITIPWRVVRDAVDAEVYTFHPVWTKKSGTIVPMFVRDGVQVNSADSVAIFPWNVLHEALHVWEMHLEKIAKGSFDSDWEVGLRQADYD